MLDVFTQRPHNVYNIKRSATKIVINELPPKLFRYKPNLCFYPTI